MTISSSEQRQITCRNCDNKYTAEAWTLIDAAERPDLAQALRDDRLNVAVCPECGMGADLNVPLLFHDPANRRVYFAAPAGADEYAWRESAQELLFALLSGIPEDERQPYLGDVQVEQDVAGVHRAILRNERRRAGGAPRPAAVPVIQESIVDTAPTPSASDNLYAAVQQLMAADSEADFASIVENHPALLTPAGDAVVRDVAAQAETQGEHEIAAALNEVRAALARMRSGDAADETLPADTRHAASASGTSERDELPSVAYQALLMAGSRDELFAATRDYPALLEAWADADLTERLEAALYEGNERLAHEIETHREVLAALRESLGGPEGVQRAVRALLGASGEDAVAAALEAHPMLLTNAAQEALVGVEDEARTRGDTTLADHARACRTMLETVRAGLEDR